ncbi:alpha/beta hydrolase family protein [Chitinophaga filiformis]|uniref:Prolyl oligopeptidase family protein n=1 Tax=Chitinophaga filiformis TaxID=104663 RepID=A0A1G7HVE0_CHIFI|nr:prolyl oligopeptidase family serine peptidase [Chitinophaga filiformis]SDF04487.1 Prolyl oligopeptidase family protein [Chitinophaga filiformis]
MMRIFVIYFLLFVISENVWAQKNVIDKAACDNWESLHELSGKSCILSNDGKYVVYQYGKEDFQNFVVIKELMGPLYFAFYNAMYPKISQDSKTFLALLPSDSLVILTFSNKRIEYISNVRSYSIPDNGLGKWMCYIVKGNPDCLVVKNLSTGKSRSYFGADNSWFNGLGNDLVIRTAKGLVWLDLNSWKEELIPESKNSGFLSFDNTGSQIAFITKSNGNELKYFKKGMPAPIILADKSFNGINGDFSVGDFPVSFSKGEAAVVFCLKKNKEQIFQRDIRKITNAVTVWNYKDLGIPEMQKRRLDELENGNYMAVVNINTKNIVQLEDDSLFVEYGCVGDGFALVSTRVMDDEFYWNGQIKRLFLVTLKDGRKREVFASGYPAYNNVLLSPTEKFVVWFDATMKEYWCYSIDENRSYSISSKIDEPLCKSQRGEADRLRDVQWPYGVSNWVSNQEALLIYGQYDIWKIDPFGRLEPVNITRGFGKKNSIIFRTIAENKNPLYIYPNELLLSAFNPVNKENGFWSIDLNKLSNPKKRIMDSYAYYFASSTSLNTSQACEDPGSLSYKPIKSKSTNIFIVRRMSIDEAPNLFFTSDFRDFKEVTKLKPQATYNWMTSELVRWKLPDGFVCSGILYKPENFDSSRKYPVILNYYERRSDGLNVFRMPRLSGHNIDIAWYVSRGYLIFEPDIYYRPGKTAQSIVDVVTSAVNYLSMRKYINKEKLGIQGQSFGGYETNVLATQTNIFAAACQMAGPTDLISEYGSIRVGGINNQASSDVGQRNLRVFPWEHPDIFIENSPIFHIGKMTTPLLIVHNKDDGAISYSQGLELYLNMRRARKKVWLLEYDKEGHDILDPNNQLDFTIRMQQFFDYYLKDCKPPYWMTRGIAINLREYDSGLGIDSSGLIP